MIVSFNVIEMSMIHKEIAGSLMEVRSTGSCVVFNLSENSQ